MIKTLPNPATDPLNRVLFSFQNITSVYDCDYSRAEAPLDCKDKRNCISLHGLYDCSDGQCAKVNFFFKSGTVNFPPKPVNK